MGASAGCDRGIMSKSSPEEGAQDKSVVQTEWKNEGTANMSAKEMLPAEKPADSNPLGVEQNSPMSAESEYVVQIGAFLNRNNADRLVEKLNKKGFPATLSVSEKSVKKWHIVRIGAFNVKKEAVEAAGRYTSSENSDSVVLLNGKVVKLVKPGDEEMSAGASTERKRKRTSKNDRFTFQVGGLMSKAAAKKQESKLQKKGYSPYITEMTSTINNEIWYTVRIGKFYTIDEAANAAANFAAKENIPTKADLVMR